MISLCIKNNNKNLLNYLLNNISDKPLENMIYTNRHFKLYDNIILHYKGKNIPEFYEYISNLLTNCILCFYEESMIYRLISFNYFYFDDYEKKQIQENCKVLLAFDENREYTQRIDCMWTAILKYITENKSILLDGFVTFRLFDYISYLDSAVDSAVNKYIIDKEYIEFIHLLQAYIHSRPNQADSVHLIYMNGESILLDEQKNIIPVSNQNLNAHFLSDISFSSNDYALNTLLTLLPNTIIIHLIDKDDEFIHTLELIFGNHVHLCTDCNICKTYQLLNTSFSSSKTHSP